MSDEIEQKVFVALADPTRRQLLERLSAEGGKTATELAESLPITRQGVTKHLKILAEAELVEVRKLGRERRYQLAPEPLDAAVGWVAAVTQQWDKRLQSLSDYLSNDDSS